MSRIQRDIRGKLVTYFKTRLGMFNYKSGWMKGDCPNCGKSLKFGVNISQDRTNCFVCTYNDRPIEVVMMVEGLSDRFAVFRFLNAFEDAPLIDPYIKELVQKPAELPEGFTLLSMGTSQVSKIARSYMRGRGFNVKELSLQGVGYCARGPYKMRIILPFYAAGRLIYFNARQFIEIGAKFKNPKIEDFGIGKNMLMYNIDALSIYTTIYLVESVTNALTLGSNAIAIGGKVLSGYQLSKILKSKIKRVIVILDNDATDYAIQIALKICNYKKTKVVIMPDEKDVNDRGRKEVKRMTKETPWGNYSYFLKLKFQYEKTLDSHN
jgi:DNA primase